MQVFRRSVSFWFLVLFASATTTPSTVHRSPAAGSRLPNIIVITLDTTRADRMDFLGSKRALTPNLDALAHDGVVFEHAYAHMPLTTPSHTSIFTGTYPQFNHVTVMGHALSKDLPYLPDLLHQHGYKTAAFVGSYIVDPTSPAAPGFGRGFDTYDAPFHKRGKGEDRYQSMERRAETVVDNALAWLDTHKARPFFVWVHCYDPHAPYDPPEPYKTRYAGALYDGEIAYTDSAMSKLFAGLRARGLYDGSLIALMADHGEGLGDHGENHHGMFLYDATLHVPLLFKFPKERFGGSRVENRARLVDVAPTILQEVGLPVPKMMQGESLLAMIKPPVGDAAAHEDRPAYAESDYGQRAYGWSYLRAWRTGKYLYVDAPDRELYDQTTDLQALHNRAADSQAVADTLQSQMDAFRRKTARAAPKQGSLSPELVDSLRALGYVGTDATSTTETGERGPDPKGKVQIANLLDDALEANQADDFQTAIPKFEQVIKEEPRNAVAYLELGQVYVSLEQYDKALPLLRTAVEKLPGDSSAHYQLGEAMAKSGDWAGALPQLRAAAAIVPNSSQVRLALSVAYEETQQIPEAIDGFRETLRLDPENFAANLRVGRLLGMQGRPTEALPYLRHATELRPDSRDAHMFLSNVYGELGQKTNALRERQAAQEAASTEQPQQ